LLLAGGVQVELLGLLRRGFLVGGLRLGECDGRGEEQRDGDGDGAEQLGHMASRRGNPARPSNTRQEIASARETCSFAATNFFWSASTWTAYRSANSTAACARSLRARALPPAPCLAPGPSRFAAPPPSRRAAVRRVVRRAA